MVSEKNMKKFIENFKRKLRIIKKSDFYFDCDLCEYPIKRNTLYVIDSRNDKYCTNCADKILFHQINKLDSFKKSLHNESMLDELEEDDDEKK